MTLKELRKKAGLKQMAVAYELNVTQSAICRWETGRNGPLKKYCGKLAKLYGVNAETLNEAIKETMN